MVSWATILEAIAIFGVAWMLGQVVECVVVNSALQGYVLQIGALLAGLYAGWHSR